MINFSVIGRKIKLWNLARKQKKMIKKAQQKALDKFKIQQEIKKEK